MKKILGMMLAAAVVAGTARVAMADSAAVAFAQNLGNTAIARLTDPALGEAARVARMRKLLEDSFDVAAVSRFVLGPWVRRTTPAQLKEFETLYTTYVAYNYAGLFKRYNGQKVKMNGERPVPGGNDVDVSGVIVQPNGPPVPLDLRLRPEGGSFKVVDLKVDSVSMPLTHRHEFGAVIAQNDGKVSALMTRLRDADARLEKETPSR